MYQRCSHWTDLREIYIGYFYESVDEFQIWFQSGKKYDVGAAEELTFLQVPNTGCDERDGAFVEQPEAMS
jgi:hypothetical protein